MGWREQLRPASFKGVPFFVADHEAEYGRRLVANEYPFRDTPYTEDMGRAVRRWTVTAYVLGQDYMASRDAIIDAIEGGGAGQLVHPYLGTKDVIGESARVRETTRDGGYVEIAITFVEAGSRKYPNSEPVPARLAALGADNVMDIASGNFIDGINVESVSEWVRDSYAGGLIDAAAIFKTIQNTGGITVQSTVAKINQAADWAASLAELENPSVSLVQNVAGVASRVVSMFKGVLDLSATPKDSARQFEKFAGFTAPSTTETSAMAEITKQNSAVLQHFIRTGAVAAESKALVQREFSYYEEAIEARKALLERIDQVAAASTDDSEFSALQALRKQVGAAIPTDEQSLPRLGTLVLRQSAPALVVAYDLYESVSRETDIVARNNVRHPGFLPGGSPLEILKDA